MRHMPPLDKRRLIAIAVACASILAIYGSKKIADKEDVSGQDVAAGVSPAPRTETEAVPQYREDGVVPLPSDAIGTSGRGSNDDRPP